MKGSRLLLLGLLALGAGLGLLIAGAPWDTPDEPVRAIEITPPTTLPEPTTTTTTSAVDGDETTTTTDLEDGDGATTTTEGDAAGDEGSPTTESTAQE